MKIINDNSCGWLNNLQRRKNFKLLNQNQKCDYLIVGAGYTGLSTARKLSEINSSKKIIIVDAQLAGEGSSSRNSGSSSVPTKLSSNQSIEFLFSAPH